MGNVIGIAIVWFIIEMLVWYLIAQFVSGWWVFGWFILAGIVGLSLIKKGTATLKPMASQMQTMGMMNPSMRPPENTIMKAISFSIAGILLLLPGVISDVIAILALLPPVQNKAKDFAKNYAMKNQDKLMQMMASRMGGIDPSQMGGFGGMGGNPFGNMGGQNPFANNPFGNFGNMQSGNFRGTTVDGEAKTINKNTKKITHSANDD